MSGSLRLISKQVADASKSIVSLLPLLFCFMRSQGSPIMTVLEAIPEGFVIVQLDGDSSSYDSYPFVDVDVNIWYHS